MARARALGYIEAMAAISHERIRGGAQIMASACISGPLQPHVLRAGLAAVQARHPLLRAVIRHAESGYWFDVDETGPAIDLRVSDLRVSERQGEAHWKEVAEQEMTSPLDASARLWRAVLLRDPAEVAPRHELLLSFHHAVADGVGVAAVVRDLLRCCSAVATLEATREATREATHETTAGAIAEAVGPGDAPPPLLRPPVEARLRQRRSLAAYREIARTIAAQQPALTPWPVSAPAPVSERTSRIAYRELGAAEVEGLVQRARREDTTVNAALAAAMLVAGARTRNMALATSMFTAVSLRRHCEPMLDEDELGCFISTVRTHHEAVTGESALWPLARAYRSSLLARIPIEAFRPLEPDYSTFSTLFDAEAASRQTELPRHFGLSNMGVLNVPVEQGAFRLQALRICSAQHAGIYVGFLHAATAGGKMSLCLAYPDPLVQGAWAEAFLDQVVDLVQAP